MLIYQPIYAQLKASRINLCAPGLSFKQLLDGRLAEFSISAFNP